MGSHELLRWADRFVSAADAHAGELLAHVWAEPDPAGRPPPIPGLGQRSLWVRKATGAADAWAALVSAAEPAPGDAASRPGPREHAAAAAFDSLARGYAAAAGWDWATWPGAAVLVVCAKGLPPDEYPRHVWAWLPHPDRDDINVIEQLSATGRPAAAEAVAGWVRGVFPDADLSEVEAWGRVVPGKWWVELGCPFELAANALRAAARAAR